MDLVKATVLALGAFFVGVIGNLFANECYDRAPSLARRIIRHAAQRLRTHLRGRYEEEWLSHAADCPGKLGQLVHAFGCLRASYRLSSKLSLPRHLIKSVILHSYRQNRYLLIKNPRLLRWLNFAGCYAMILLMKVNIKLISLLCNYAFGRRLVALTELVMSLLPPGNDIVQIVREASKNGQLIETSEVARKGHSSH